jgi:peptidase S46-like protein
MNGTRAPYKTTFAGLYDRSDGFDGKPPFDLTPRFIERRARIDMATPLNFVTTNDIIGGNSGSPVVNRAANWSASFSTENIESLVGRFVYEGEKNRSVAVHAGAIALRAVYDAGALANELDPPGFEL